MVIRNILMVPALAWSLLAGAQQTVPPPITSQTPAQNQNTRNGLTPAQDPTMPTTASAAGMSSGSGAAKAPAKTKRKKKAVKSAPAASSTPPQ